MHNVEKLGYVNNTNLAATGVPWHGLGQSFEDWMTDAQAAEVIGWKVRKDPAFRLAYHYNDEKGLQKSFESVDDTFFIVRDDTNAVLGTVGSLYAPIQNDELIEFGSVLVDDFGAKWDTVASLRDGRIVFATLRLDVVTGEGRGLVPFDDSEYCRWLLLTNDHTGNKAFTAAKVNIRTVCENTLTMGLRSAKQSWKIRHVGDVNDKVNEARVALDLSTKYDDEFAKTAAEMAEIDCDLDAFTKLAEDLIPKPELRPGRSEADRTSLIDTFRGSGNIANEWRHTNWGAYNAVTEWSQHVRDERQDKRIPKAERKMLSTLYGGTSQNLADKAFGKLRPW